MIGPIFINRKLIEQYRLPGVYIAFDGDEIIYIGKTVNGISRPVNPGHHKLKMLKFDLLFIPIEDINSIWLVELNLIQILKPKLNYSYNSTLQTVALCPICSNTLIGRQTVCSKRCRKWLPKKIVSIKSNF